MKIDKLIEKLEQIKAKSGNLEVMYHDGDGDSVWEISFLRVHITQEDEYPEDWNMPKKFVMISNG